VPDTLTRRRDYSADGVRRSLEDSMGLLGLDRTDIALVHDPEAHMEQAMSEAVPALVKLREQGVVAAAGVGMNHWEPLLPVVTGAGIDVVMVVGRWTLVDRTAAPVLAACAERQASVLAAAPFNSGLLAAHGRPPERSSTTSPLPSACVTWPGSSPSRVGGAAPRYRMPRSASAAPPAPASVVAGIRTAAEARSDAT
jgi:D-threo-aldose 1-dehydrogenase